MAIERTFSIIKPDATRRNLTGAINAVFEKNGLRIVAQKRIHMTRQMAETFYGVHSARPFFNDLCRFIIKQRLAEILACQIVDWTLGNSVSSRIRSARSRS